MKNLQAMQWLLAAMLCVSGLSGQDSIQLHDGRFVIDKKMTRTDEGVLVNFKNGKVMVPASMVKSTTARTASGEGSELSAEAKENMAKGLVFFKGRWVRAGIRDKALAKAKKKRDAMIKEAKMHRLWKDRYILKTRNFEFQYTIDPEVMKGYAELMETYYKEFVREWKIRKPRKLKKRLKVCFYHDYDYFKQVGGAPNGAIGYFRFIEPIELNFYYDRLDEELTQDVMFHETNHYLTHLIDPKFNYPAWVEESLGEYYGASEWDPKKKKMKVGGIQEGRLAVIQDMTKLNTAKSGTGAVGKEGEWLGLEEMIRIKRFEAVHYAWGWTFVHFLMETPKYKKRFMAYFKGLANDKKIKKVLARGGYNRRSVEPEEQIKWLKTYLKISDLKALEKEWHNYIRTLKQATDRGYQQAGSIALMRGKPIKAQRLFRTALSMGNKNPMTHYGLAKAQYRKGKYSEALASIDNALKGDPLNGMFYVWKAKCVERGSDGGYNKNDPEARRLKRLALEIEPDNYQVMLEVAWENAFDEDEKSGNK